MKDQMKEDEESQTMISVINDERRSYSKAEVKVLFWLVNNGEEGRSRK